MSEQLKALKEEYEVAVRLAGIYGASDVEEARQIIPFEVWAEDRARQEAQCVELEKAYLALKEANVLIPSLAIVEAREKVLNLLRLRQ